MDLEILSYLTWREVLMAIVALLAVYILVTFRRIQRLKNENADRLPGHAAQSAIKAYTTVDEALPDTSVAQPLIDTPLPQDAAGHAAQDVTSQEMAGVSRLETLEQDVAQLRRELGSMREELQTLRDEHRRAFGKAQLAQNASPFYSDAMQMAMQGQGAADISALCGISRAEADLVVALARNRDQPLG